MRSHWRTEASPARLSLWRLGRQEFLVAAGNPKAILIFTAFLPQFVDPGQPLGAQFPSSARIPAARMAGHRPYSYAGLHLGGCSPASGPGVCSTAVAPRCSAARDWACCQPPSGLTVPLRFEETHCRNPVQPGLRHRHRTARKPGWKCSTRCRCSSLRRNRRRRRTDPVATQPGNQALTFTSQAYQLADALKGIDAAQSGPALAPGGKPKPLVLTPCWRKTPRRPPRRPTSKLHLPLHRLWSNRTL